MINKILMNKSLTFISRLVVGFVLIVASVPKIADPAAFAKSIEAYNLFPHFIVSSSALVVPWLELILGLFLIFGILLRGSSLLSSVLFFFFSILIAVTLLRGLSIDCGCFGFDGAALSWKRLLEDVGLILLSLQIFYHTTRKNLNQIF
jgi:putative oxidoreductase